MEDTSARRAPRYPIRLSERAITEQKADIARRALQVIQTVLKSQRFGVTYFAPEGGNVGELNKLVLVRRLWVHALLENDWLSSRDMQAITQRDHKTIELDRAVIDAWCKHSVDFRELVLLVEEAVDACIALISSAPRLFKVASAVAVEVRQLRQIKRTAPLPTRSR
jgi:hypothetical protein